jgi:hypothetical protein
MPYEIRNDDDQVVSVHEHREQAEQAARDLLVDSGLRGFTVEYVDPRVIAARKAAATRAARRALLPVEAKPHKQRRDDERQMWSVLALEHAAHGEIVTAFETEFWGDRAIYVKRTTKLRPESSVEWHEAWVVGKRGGRKLVYRTLHY